jgi:hypothetical protein
MRALINGDGGLRHSLALRTCDPRCAAHDLVQHQHATGVIKQHQERQELHVQYIPAGWVECCMVGSARASRHCKLE